MLAILSSFITCIVIFTLDTEFPRDFKNWVSIQEWVRTIFSLCSQQTVVQQNNIEARHRNRNPGLSIICTSSSKDDGR